jgi:hypothetical protein
MPKTRNKLRADFANSTETMSPSLTRTTSKYFSSKTNVTETNKLNKSSSLSKTVTHKTTRKHINIETEESSANTNVNNLEKRLDKEPPTSPPVGWEEVYNAIKEYRKNIIAPVDTMGCERLADEPSDNITPQVLIY